jgi:hypothetical protein
MRDGIFDFRFWIFDFAMKPTQQARPTVRTAGNPSPLLRESKIQNPKSKIP